MAINPRDLVQQGVGRFQSCPGPSPLQGGWWGAPQFCCRKRHQLGRTAQQHSGVSSESKGGLSPNSLADKSKAPAPFHPLHLPKADGNFRTPSQLVKSVVGGHPESLHCCQMQIPEPLNPVSGGRPWILMLPGGPDVLQCVRPVSHRNWDWVSLLPVPLGARASLGQVLCSGSWGL